MAGPNRHRSTPGSGGVDRTSALLLCGAFLMLTLPACGDGGGGDDTLSPELGTLAYVETECRDTKEGFFERQALRIRQGDDEPVTVFETPVVGPITGIGGLCRALAAGRFGARSITREPFQAVTVSPDGASVAFEVTDEFSVDPPLPLNLPPDRKGIFWVRADGTGLLRVGPPSRTPFFALFQSGSLVDYSNREALRFNPSGRTIIFADKAPDDADQLFTIDVASGARAQVTHQPPGAAPTGYPANAPTVWGPRFDDQRTISFWASANPDGLNPPGDYLLMTIKTDEYRLEVPLPIPVPLPDATIELRFVITGDRPQATDAAVPGKPTNDPPLLGFPQDIPEVFVIDEGKNVLQLTNFRRVDTWYPFVDVDREHVYFSASTNELGTNPSYNCQIFSIERTGGNLRQLTNFRETEHSVAGCSFGARPRGCAVGKLWQDPRTRTLLFYSNCDPFGTTPNGGQIFAIQPDGSGLRELTTSRGLVKEADGTSIGELLGPWAYGPYVP